MGKEALEDKTSQANEAEGDEPRHPSCPDEDNMLLTTVVFQAVTCLFTNSPHIICNFKDRLLLLRYVLHIVVSLRLPQILSQTCSQDYMSCWMMGEQNSVHPSVTKERGKKGILLGSMGKHFLLWKIII